MSQYYRTQIGLARGRIVGLLEQADNIDDVEDVQDSSPEELYADVYEVHALAGELRKEVFLIESHKAKWNTLMVHSPKEKEVYDSFIQRTGDFNKDVESAVKKLKELESKYLSFIKLYEDKATSDNEEPPFPPFAPHSDTLSPTSPSVPRRATPTTSPTVKTPAVTRHTTSPIPKEEDDANPLLPSQQLDRPATSTLRHEVQPPIQSNFVPSSQPTTLNLQPPPMPIHHAMQPTYAYMPPLTHLAPITLPSFTGDRTSYITFIEMFDSLIDVQPIPDINKLHYLLGALKDDAARLVESLQLRGDNYSTARQILHDQYYDIAHVRQTLTRKLNTLPTLVNSSSLEDRKKFYITASSTYYQLKKIQPDADNITNADLIIGKLPRRYLDKIYSGVTQNILPVSEVLHKLNALIKHDELINTIAGEEQPQEKRVTTMAVQQSHHHANGRTGQAAATSAFTPITPCAFCSTKPDVHRHEDCPVFKTQEQRRQRAIEMRMCFKCLRTGHRSNECRKGRPCFVCRGAHHTALCQQKERGRSHSRPPTPHSGYSGHSGNSRHSTSPTPWQQRAASPARFQPTNYGYGNRPAPPSGQQAQSQGSGQQRQTWGQKVHFNNTSVANAEEIPSTVTFTSISASTVTAPLPDTISIVPVDNTACPKEQIVDNVDEDRSVAMMVIDVTIEDNQGQTVGAPAFFDSGSNLSYMQTDLSHELDLPIYDQKIIQLTVFNEADAKTLVANRYIVTFHVQGRLVRIPLVAIPRIAGRLSYSNVDESTLENLMKDENAVLPRSSEKPRILIGLDYMSRLLGNTSSKNLPNGTTVHYTDCGTVVTGIENPTPKAALIETDPLESDKYYCHSVQSEDVDHRGLLSFNAEEEHAALRRVVERFWNLESAGILDNPRTTDEEAAAEFFEKTTTRDDDGRYRVRWPFKESAENLPSNYHLAYHRLQSTLRRLQKEPSLYQKYDDIITDQLQREFIEKVDPNMKNDNPIHYLAHHPVLKPTSASTKVRIVYDASAKASKLSRSFNDILHAGESLLPKINGVLIRLRKPKIIISADIEKAFLTMALHQEDQDLCRFLWQPPGYSTPQCYRFRRVPFGVKTSPYLLNAVIKRHLTADNSELATSILRNIYVDNIFQGVNTVNEGIQFHKESILLFAAAKMNLTQFVSNSPQLNLKFAEKQGEAPDPDQKLLGVGWSTTTDLLRIGTFAPIPHQLSKRRILQAVASIYDPLGIISPVVLKGKLFFQRLWASSTNWDEPLTQAEVEEWNQIQKDVTGPPIEFRRQYFSSPTLPTDQFELHVFSDASEAAYGAVAYVRRIRKDVIECSLITAKCLVAPLKKVNSIPQLELMGLEKAAHLARVVTREFDETFHSTVIWSDSMCTIDQVATNSAGSVFGRNRLRVINNVAPSNCIFSHVKGVINPADVVSRGATLEDLRNHKLWWTGPDFLLKKDLPIRQSSSQVTTSVAISKPLDVLHLDPHRFSSFRRMLNVIVRMILLFNPNHPQPTDKAKSILLKLAQDLDPVDEDTIRNLHLEKDVNGIWFYPGRVPDRRVPYLPNGHIAKLYILEMHLRNKHSSPVVTLAKVRNEVWITKGLSVIKRALQSCPFCKVLKARRSFQPDFPMLPDSRTKWNAPFTFAGLDYAGPLNARCNGTTKKYWIVILTCLTTRYTAMELVPSQDSKDLLNALRRIVAQYGMPTEIITDNGTSIKMVGQITQEASSLMHQFGSLQELPHFKHIPAHSPWSGGVYERMVGLLKTNLLKSGATRRLMDEDDLRTLLKECETVVNSRPITVVSNDDVRPIRPFDLVSPTRREQKLLHVMEEVDSESLNPTHSAFLENWMRTTSVTSYLIRKWNEEYIQVLQSRHQTRHVQDRHTNQTPPEVGEVVIYDRDEGFAKTSTINWPLAKVTEVKTRSVKLLTADTGRIIERPLKKICQLELQPATPATTSVPKPADPPTTSPSIGPTTRSRSRSTPAPLRSTPRSMSATTNHLIALTMLVMMFAPATAVNVPNIVNPPSLHWPMSLLASSASVQDAVNGIFQTTMIGIGIILLGCLLFIMALMTRTIFGFFECSRAVLSCSCRTLKFIWKSQLLWIKCLFNCVRRPNNTHRELIVVIFLLSFPTPAPSCNDVASLVAHENSCFHDVDTNLKKCNLNSVSVITATVNGSTSCLNFQHEDDETFLTAKFKAEAFISRCVKKTVFFSRDYKLNHEYVMRCDSVGSCSIEKCGSISLLGAHHTALCQQKERGRSHSRPPTPHSGYSGHSGNSRHSTSPTPWQQRAASPARFQPTNYGYGNRPAPPSGQQAQSQGSGQQRQTWGQKVHFNNTSVANAEEIPSTVTFTSISASTVTAPLPDTISIVPVDNTACPKEQIVDNVDEDRSVAMMVIDVTIEDNQGQTVGAPAFFDSGSNLSYMQTDLSHELDLPIYDQKIIQLTVFNEADAKTLVANRYIVTFHVQGRLVRIPLVAIPRIAGRLSYSNVDESTLENLMKDENAVLPRSSEKPRILIGLDYMSRLLGNTSSKNLPNGTTVHYTDCGTVVTGIENPTPKAALIETDPLESDKYYCHSVQSEDVDHRGLLSFNAEEEHAALRRVVERFWNLESAGILDNPRTTDEEAAAEFFEKTTTRDDDGRYRVRWPFKESAENLPSNYHLAYHRLQSTLRRLQKEPSLYQKYDDIITDQLQREFIEKVDPNMKNDNPIHYLAHHPVLKPTSASTKVRIVYDASAKASKLSRSFNDILHAGESLLPKINGVLIRLRKPKIIISADIEKAFLTMALHQEDQDLCRFLWQPPGYSTPQCYRFRRVPFGVKTSPYLLNAVIKRHLTADNSELATSILRNIYVDNIFQGVNTVNEGIQFHKESILLFAAAKMNLTQFVSNSPQLNLKFAEKQGEAPDPDQKLLGVGWSTTTDLLRIGTFAPIPHQLSKRRILQAVASIYDPLGIISPVVLKGKLFFQRLWASSTNWDEPLTQAEVEEWNQIQKDVTGPPIEFRRQYFSSPTLPTDQFELHVFSDASEAAYGAVAYVRRIRKDVIECSLITAKCLVAPLKKVNSIPQLELMGLEKAAHLARVVTREFDETFHSTVIWSDSMCTIDQVATNSAGSVFGRNRLRVINNVAPSNCIFSHVKGVINPADVVSRGATLEDLRNHKLWWTGPDFLLKKDLPIRQSSSQVTTSVAISKPLDVLHLDPHRFSSFRRMLNVIVRMILLFNPNHPQPTDKAKSILLKLAQDLDPVDEDTIRNLHLEKDVNGIWFYPGRVPDRRVPYLPNGHIAKLYILEMHLRNKHSSPVVTLAKVRNEVWITKGLSVIKRALQSCPFCKVLKARRSFQPDFPMLPDSRTKWNAPFTFAGLDYAGPLNARCNGTTKKYWIVILTCLTTRYTAMELVPSQDSKDLLNALRRIVAQYGMPTEIITDNGTSIKMVGQITQEASSLMHQFGSLQELPHFKHIPAHSPWSGGVYERMVGLLKTNLLKSGATRRLMDEDDLRTLLKECETVVNSRPITVVSNDDVRPIRPFDLVSPTRREQKLLHVMEEVDSESLNPTHSAFLENWMRTTSVTSYLIRKWNEEYIQVLQSRHQTRHVQDRHTNQTPPEVGEVVIYDRDEGFAKTSTINWPLAKVTEVKTRSVKLLTADTGRIIERPLKKICQLELQPATPATTSVPKPADPPTTSPSIGPTTRSRSRSTPAPLRSTPRSMSATTNHLIALTMLVMMFAPATAVNVPNIVNPPSLHWPMSLLASSASVQDAVNGIFQTTMIGIGIILLGCLLFIMALMTRTIFGFFECSRAVLSCSCRTLKFIWKSQLLWIKCLFNCVRRPNNTHRELIVVIFLLSFPTPAPSCNDVASLVAHENSCFHDVDTNLKKCNLNSVSVITATVNGSTSCLNFQHEDDETFLTAKFKAEAFISRCVKKTVFFSRDYKLNHEYVMRCDSVGSCSIEKCGSISFNEDIPELSPEAKQKPGFTGCAPGCGGWHCRCFYYDPSCLFYRYYATPTSNDIYEIFQCPTWTTLLRVNVEIGQFKMSVELTPGVKFPLPGMNISITATSVHAPPLNLHSATYVSAYGFASNTPHWTAFTFTPPAAPGTPAKGFTGEFQCSTRKDAEDFNCVFDRQLCKCAGFATKVNCQCSNTNLAGLNATSSLPRTGVNHKILTVNGLVETVAVSNVVVSLHLEMRNATITRSTTVQTCFAKQNGPLEGCHSCFRGGLIPIKCTSKETVKALIHCGFIESTLECSPIGSTNMMQIGTDIPDVALNCSVDCGRRTYIAIRGVLDAPTGFRVNASAYSSPYARIVEGAGVLSEWMSRIQSQLINSLITPLYILLGVVLLYVLFRFLRNGLSRSISKRQLRLKKRSQYM